MFSCFKVSYWRIKFITNTPRYIHLIITIFSVITIPIKIVFTFSIITFTLQNFLLVFLFVQILSFLPLLFINGWCVYRCINEQNEQIARHISQLVEKYQHNLENEKTRETPHQNLLFIPSETSSDNLHLNPDKLLYLKSSANYVEVYYMKNGEVKKQIIRNNLKTLEQSLTNSYSILIRCHRSYMINMNKIISMKGNAQGYRLKLKNLNQEIPVSRSYIKTLKEILQTQKNS